MADERLGTIGQKRLGDARKTPDIGQSESDVGQVIVLVAVVAKKLVVELDRLVQRDADGCVFEEHSRLDRHVCGEAALQVIAVVVGLGLRDVDRAQ